MADATVRRVGSGRVLPRPESAFRHPGINATSQIAASRHPQAHQDTRWSPPRRVRKNSATRQIKPTKPDPRSKKSLHGVPHNRRARSFELPPP